MATPLKPGQRVPDFTLPGGQLADDRFQRRDYTLGAQRSRPLLLAFYPGDNTPVCTKQLCSYSSGLDAFQDLGADVWAVSPQDVDSHEAFAREHALRMPLLADTDRAVAREYGVAAPVLGLRRSVFLIAPDGTLAWRHIGLVGATFPKAATLTSQLAALRDA